MIVTNLKISVHAQRVIASQLYSIDDLYVTLCLLLAYNIVAIACSAATSGIPSQ